MQFDRDYKGWYVWYLRLFWRLTSNWAPVLLVPFLVLGSKSISLSAGFSYVSLGCMIRLTFCRSISSLSQHNDLVSTCFKAGLQVYLCLGLYVHGLKEYSAVFWEFDHIFRFFASYLLITEADGISEYG